MEKVNNFFEWFTLLGGETKNLDMNATYSKLNNIPLFIPTLKNRAKEIKEKYNHKFKIS